MCARSVSVGPAGINDGELRAVDVDGNRVAIAKVEGRLYAFDDMCTHEQCSLTDDGILDGTIVTCGCHGAQFDVTNGQVVAPPAPAPVKTYPVRVEGGQLLIEV